MDGYIDRWMDR